MIGNPYESPSPLPVIQVGIARKAICFTFMICGALISLYSLLGFAFAVYVANSHSIPFKSTAATIALNFSIWTVIAAIGISMFCISRKALTSTTTRPKTNKRDEQTVPTETSESPGQVV